MCKICLWQLKMVHASGTIERFRMYHLWQQWYHNLVFLEILVVWQAYGGLSSPAASYLNPTGVWMYHCTENLKSLIFRILSILVVLLSFVPDKRAALSATLHIRHVTIAQQWCLNIVDSCPLLCTSPWELIVQLSRTTAPVQRYKVCTAVMPQEIVPLVSCSCTSLWELNVQSIVPVHIQMYSL